MSPVPGSFDVGQTGFYIRRANSKILKMKHHSPQRAGVVFGLLLALTLGPAMHGAAFDGNRSEVTEAYIGAATVAKRQAALGGVNELLEVLVDLPGADGGSSGSVSTITLSTAPSVLPEIDVRATSSAATDADLGLLGDPVLLDRTLLEITETIITPRDFQIGSGGAILDTVGTSMLVVDGDFNVDGLLLKIGEGELKLRGNANWDVAPFLAAGRLAGTTANLDTPIEGLKSLPGLSDIPVLRLDQGFDGELDNRIDGAIELRLEGSGDISVSTPDHNFYGAPTTIMRGTLKLVGAGRVSTGDLTITGTGLFDIIDAAIDPFNPESLVVVSNLSGDGHVRMGSNGLTILQTRDTVFENGIEGSGLAANDLGIAVLGNGSDTSSLTFTDRQHYHGPTIISRTRLVFREDGDWASEEFVLSNGILDFSAADVSRSMRSLMSFDYDGEQSQILLGPNDLNVDARDFSYFGGVISGDGGLSVFSSGTLFLTGNNQYNGTTRISRARLVARPYSISDTVINDSELELFEPNDEALPLSAYSGNISGRGRLIKSGDGIVWLRGTNSYTGGTTVEGGVLLGNTDSLQGDITIGTAAGFYQVDDGIYDGAVSGSGALLAFGPGQLTLTGENTHTGGTLFSNKLVVREAANLGAAGSPVSFVGGTLRLEGSLDSTHAFFVAAQGGTLDTNGHAFDLSGSISGTGILRKIGDGTLRLRGEHPGFSGTLALTAGRALLDTRLGGSVRIADDAVLEVAATPATATRLTLTSADSVAHIEGGHVSVTAAHGTYDSRPQHTIISAPAGIIGTFDEVWIDRNDVRAVLGYTATEVVLGIAPVDASFRRFTKSADQMNAVLALEAMTGADSTLARAAVDAVSLLSPEELPLALESIAATSLTGLTQANSYLIDSVTRIVQQRQAAFDDGKLAQVAGTGGIFAASALALALRAPADRPRHGAWARGFGGAGDIDTSDFASSQSLRYGGLVLGYDAALTTNWSAGLLFARSESTLGQDRPYSDAQTETWRLGTYGRWRGERLVVDLAASYLDHDFETARTIVVWPVAERASGAFSGHTWTVRGEAGWSIERGVTWMPYAGLRYTRQRTGGYQETGSQFALRVPSDRETSVRSEFGLRLRIPVVTQQTRKVQTYAYAAWLHEFTGDPVISASLVNDPTAFDLALRGVGSADDAANFGAGVSFSTGGGLRIFAGFDAQIDANREIVGASGGIRYAW